MCKGAETITQASPPRPRSTCWVPDEEIKHCFKLVQPKLFMFQYVFSAMGLLSAEKVFVSSRACKASQAGFRRGQIRWRVRKESAGTDEAEKGPGVSIDQLSRKQAS